MRQSYAQEAPRKTCVQGMVSIVLLNWNGKRFLQECIESVRQQTYQPLELLMIDNHSSDGSQAMLQGYMSEYRVMCNEVNLGYCGGANLGIANARGEFVLLLNPDVILHPDFLARCVDSAAQDQSIGIVSGKLLRFDRQTLDSTGQFLRKNLTPLERGYGESDTGKYEQPEYIFSCCGAVAFYRRKMLEDVRLHGEYFDETHFAFFEDSDIGWRAQLFGWRAYYAPTAIAYHYRGGGLTAQTAPRNWLQRLPFFPRVSLTEKPPFIQRHVIKNRYLTLLKNASFRDILQGLPAILRYEMLLWAYMLVTRPSLLITLLEVAQMLPQTLAKRRDIASRKTVASPYIRQWIRP